VVVAFFKSVVGVTTTTPTKPINSALVAPNDLVLPSQAMEVNVIIAISKLIRITTVTPSSKSALDVVVVAHVLVIANK
jgi:hypothetical protein